MREILSVIVKDVNRLPVSDQKQTIALEVRGEVLDIKNGQANAEFEFPKTWEITIAIHNNNFWDYRVNFSVGRRTSDGFPTLSIKSGSGFFEAKTVPSQDGYKIMVTAILSRLRDAKSKIKQPAPTSEDPRDINIPGYPIINCREKLEQRSYCTSVGRDRLNMSTLKNLIPHGTIYIAEHISDAPKLILIWKPDYLAFSPPPKTPISFHLYYHPAMSRKARDYPFGYSGDNQPYVLTGFNHLMWEFWSIHQHYQSRKKVIFVVPVGNPEGGFRHILSQSGVYRLLKEVNLFVQQMESVTYEDWALQDVGRVALSGFSRGVEFLKLAINTPGNSMDNPASFSRKFYDENLREIYNFDGTPSSGSFLDSVKRWWRGDPDRRWRIYTQDPDYGNFVDSSFAVSLNSKIEMFNKSLLRKFSGDVTTIEAHFETDSQILRSLIILPDLFFSHKDGFPTSSTDPHHWFPRYFMSHAISNSGFSN